MIKFGPGHMSPPGTLFRIPFVFGNVPIIAAPIPLAGSAAAVAVARSANLPVWAQALAGLAGNVFAQQVSSTYEIRAPAPARPSVGGVRTPTMAPGARVVYRPTQKR
jgi:hypothetical protein